MVGGRRKGGGDWLTQNSNSDRTVLNKVGHGAGVGVGWRQTQNLNSDRTVLNKVGHGAGVGVGWRQTQNLNSDRTILNKVGHWGGGGGERDKLKSQIRQGTTPPESF